MPGGQYTNLREQARSLGIEERWGEVARAYAEVNRLFGDIIKVTPSSKVVGDMALMMVTSNLSADDVLDPDKQIAFPESVVSLFRGDIGQPPGGFPQGLQKKILKGEPAITVRPGALMKPADLALERQAAEGKAGRAISECELASYLMYPQVFADFAKAQAEFSDLSILPTGVFFYGMEPQEEFAIEIDKGKTLLVSYSAVSEPDEDGMVTVYFELNGQPRPVRVPDKSRQPAKLSKPKADPANPAHLASPMPGLVVSIAVKRGESVKRGDVILNLEAMKMQTTVVAEQDGTVKEISVAAGAQVDAKDLLAVIG
jgi:pyruvate carboxylase